MAIAIDSQEASGVAHHSATSPISWSFTNTAGTLLIVLCGVTVSAGTGPSITSVTYGGQAMTQAAGTPVQWKNVSGAFLDVLYIFYLFNPPTGSNTVSVTYATGTGPGTVDGLGAAISFTGVSQIGSNAGNSDGGTISATASVSLTSDINGDMVVSGAMAGVSFNGANAPTTQSAILNNSGATAGDNIILGTQSSSGGTDTASYALSASDHWGVFALELSAAINLMPQVCL